jgi:2-polyprenyl-6-methoxyphenol hydroxylase-like FAD-dependent oxidoreductase
MDRLIKVSGNCLFQKTLGLNGDSTFIAFRLIPIENYKDKSEPHYRATIGFSYPAELDEVETEKVKVDNNDPVSVLEHVKRMTRKLRPECEMTDIWLELWELASNSPETYPFKFYNPVQKRDIQDINPLSVKAWKSSRVTLLGDAGHAMSPVLGLGANNAIQDADNLSQALLNYSPENYISCIEKYEKEMLKRTSADVLRSRGMTIRTSTPVGYFSSIFRNGFMKILNTVLNTVMSIYDSVNNFSFLRVKRIK